MAKATQSGNADLPLLWIDNLQGISQRQDPDKIPSNSSPLLLNISMTKPGTWVSRPGNALLGTEQSGVGVQGLHAYKKLDGTYKLHAVRSQDLDEYDDGSDSWGTGIDNNDFNSGTKVQSMNFLNRLYHISPSDYLRYETGGATTTVGTGDDRIQGNSIAVAQNVLYIGGRTGYEDRVYYSEYDDSGNMPTHQLWKTSQGTLASSTLWFTTGGLPVKGLVSYNELLYAFNAEACYSFDQRYAVNSSGVRKMFDIGLANPRAICICNGFLVWMSPEKKLWAWGGAGIPVPLSWDLEDDTRAEAIINLIDSDELSNVCLGSNGNQFWVSIGNITYRNTTYANAVIRGLANQDFSYVLWGLDTLPVRPMIYANTVISGTKVLVFGADDTDDVYLIDAGVNDGSTAINSVAKTAFIDFGYPFDWKECQELFIKFRPQSADNTYFTIKYAVDGKWSYTAVSTPDAGGSAVTSYGVIDTYASDYTSRFDDVVTVQFPKIPAFRTLSIEISNAQADEAFEVSAIGFKIKRMPMILRPKVAS